MKRQLLLLEDVDGLGRKGDIATAKPGYIRNYLLPQKKAVIASSQTLKMQAELQKEREKQAIIDRKEAEETASKIKGLTLTTEVKVDPDGNMYGSVSSADVVTLLGDNNIIVEKKSVLLGHSIRSLGMHTIRLRLKEGVEASFTLQIQPEGGELVKPIEEVSAGSASVDET